MSPTGPGDGLTGLPAMFASRFFEGEAVVDLGLTGDTGASDAFRGRLTRDVVGERAKALCKVSKRGPEGGGIALSRHQFGLDRRRPWVLTLPFQRSPLEERLLIELAPRRPVSHGSHTGSLTSPSAFRNRTRQHMILGISVMRKA
jgi:hypothetical protein